jgi:dihydrofolate reductase
MRKLIYHVATTVDGYIAHEDGTTKGFLEEGEHIPDYLESLKEYDAVIMGKKTYEAGYDFGMKPGDAPYPNMMHYIISKTLHLDTKDERIEIIREEPIGLVKKLKQKDGKAIYLCGGGALAGFLLENEMIDELKLKVNPVLFGAGIKLFGKSNKQVNLVTIDSKLYKSGVTLSTYKLSYT